MAEEAPPPTVPVKVSFGLKAKPKARPPIVPALVVCADDDDDDEEPAAKRARPADSAPPPPGVCAPVAFIGCGSADAFRLAAPAEPEAAVAAERLAEFVAKNGPSFEDMTRERNPGDTPFKCAPSRVAAGLTRASEP